MAVCWPFCSRPRRIQDKELGWIRCYNNFHTGDSDTSLCVARFKADQISSWWETRDHKPVACSEEDVSSNCNIASKPTERLTGNQLHVFINGFADELNRNSTPHLRAG